MSVENYALIMAGGAGTRLWPISRKNRPKQFQHFVGETTLLQEMVELTLQVLPIENIYVMATEEFGSIIQTQIPDLPLENLLYEPARRDNGPAALLGMIQIQKQHPAANVAILWSDHLIQEKKDFKGFFKASFEAAHDHPTALITVGTKPTSPDTGLGYIQMGKEIADYGDQTLFAVKAYMEKPDQATANRFLKSWEFLWNTGYKIMNAKNFIDTFYNVQPDLQKNILKLKEASTHSEIEKIYVEFPKLSIEYLFTPFIKEIYVIPTDMGWSDIGNWGALHEMLKKDAPDGMITKGNVLNVDSRDCLVFAKDRLITTVGLRDMIIVDDGDCLLIMHKDQTHRIKEVVNQLEKINEELL